MTDPRASAFATDLQDLLLRYKDLPPTERWFHMTLAGLAITDASKRASTNEDEWISLCRTVFRRVRSSVAAALTSIVLLGCSSDFEPSHAHATDASSDAYGALDAADASVFSDAGSVPGDGSTASDGNGIAEDVLATPVPSGAGGMTTSVPRPFCTDAAVDPCARYCQNLLPCCDPGTRRCGCRVGTHCSP